MIILIGESGSGKTSILNELVKREYKKAEFDGEYNAINTDSLKDDVVCIQIVSSIQDVKNRAKEKGFDINKIKCFYISVSAEERTKRMLLRGDSLDSIQRRMEIDNEEFKNAKDVADYVVKNDVLEDAVEEIIRLDRGE